MNEEKKKKDEQQEQNENQQQQNTGGNAANIDAIITSPTESVRSRHSQQTWSNTGTNISYEDQTAPGGAGSVGTGQSSGQNAVGGSVTSDSEYAHGRAEHPNKPDDNTEEPDKETKDII